MQAVATIAAQFIAGSAQRRSSKRCRPQGDRLRGSVGRAVVADFLAVKEV